MYGKIRDKTLEIASNQLKSDGKTIINPSDDIYLASGYLPVQYTDPPTVEEGYYAVPKWVQTETAIVQEWEVKKDNRPFSAEQITDMFIKENINTLSVDDQTALRMKDFYPEWKPGVPVSDGYKVRYNGQLYKVVTAHTTQVDWTPDAAVTMFEKIDETHDGTQYDPIPYDGNMTLYSGKYYTQNGVIYVCTRDSGNPVYHALADLVGLYVEIVTE